MPSAAELAAWYPPTYYGDTTGKFGRTLEWMVHCMTQLRARHLTLGLPPGCRVLDVGCGRGDLVLALAARGFEAHGTELFPVQKPGLEGRMHYGADLEALDLEPGTFQLVVLWHVLEHLIDPQATLEAARQLLVPGGRLVVAVPNLSSWQASLFGADWFHLDLPRHLHHFTLVGLRRLLERVGYGVIRDEHFSLRQNPFGWVQSTLNWSGPGGRNALYQRLQRRPAGQPPYLGAWATLREYGLAALLTPCAGALSILAALARRGGSMTLYAQRPIE